MSCQSAQNRLMRIYQYTGTTKQFMMNILVNVMVCIEINSFAVDYTKFEFEDNQKIRTLSIFLALRRNEKRSLKNSEKNIQVIRISQKLSE